MIPLVLTIAFALVSFVASGFIILRLVIPILPPHPLSRRASPAEFGLPTLRTLSLADQTHVWLASLDLIALASFLWETTAEDTGGASNFASAADPVSSTRHSVFLTIRQTFLLVVTGITLLHVRLGRPVSFGKSHWIIWAPSAVFVLTSATLSGVVSGAGINTLFYGLIAYNSTIVVATVVAFSCLMGTLLAIKHNLNALDQTIDPWPPVHNEKPRPSFAIDDIEALREGGSWISSNSSTSCHHNSLSAWSFSTQETTSSPSLSHERGQHGGRCLVPIQSSYRVGSPREDVPPVPPLPSPYRRFSPTAVAMSVTVPDSFRRDTPSASVHVRGRFGSRTSWLTSTGGSPMTMSAWSFSTHEPSFYSTNTPDVRTPSVITSSTNTPVQRNGGYGCASCEIEKMNTLPGMDYDASIGRNLGWFFLILLPYAFSLPYLIIASQERSPPFILTVLFMLSVMLSSPILALNILLKCPFPIPAGLFDASTHLPADLREAKDNLVSPHWPNEYKRDKSTSVTVVEDRRSGDVWIAKGDAVDGKSKLGRTLEVLNPCPKLSVLPPQEAPKLPTLTPAQHIRQDDSSPVIVHALPKACAPSSHKKTESKSSSHFSGREESLAAAGEIMVAHRHYSTLAQTIVVPGTSPGKEQGKSSSAGVTPLGHLRSRSMSLVSRPVTPPPSNTFGTSPSTPPSFPLPPTPPSVRNTRLASVGRLFSSGFGLEHVGGINRTHVLTAIKSPPLAPGLNNSEDLAVYSSLGGHGRGNGLTTKVDELSVSFPFPRIPSTPARKARDKRSGHRRSHYNLPGSGFGKDGNGNHSLASWGPDIHKAIEPGVTQFQYPLGQRSVRDDWKNTFLGAESIPRTLPRPYIPFGIDGGPETIKFVRSASPRLHLNIPQVNSARISFLGMNNPVSVTSSVTPIQYIEDDFGCGPLAESTPHSTVTKKKVRKPPPPPLSLGKPVKTRPTITYFGSEDPDCINITPPDAEPTTVSAMASIAQLSSLPVKPLLSKARKPQHSISNVSSSVSGVKPHSAKTGLRPLMILQDRTSDTTSSSHLTRPLAIGKRQESCRVTKVFRDENTPPKSSGSCSTKNLKPLKLVGSGTSRMQGILRQKSVAGLYSPSFGK